MMMNLSHPLILGSNSPRRQEILRNAGFNFEVKSIDVDESFGAEIPITELAEHLAIRKNNAYKKQFKNHLIVTADTTVVIEGVVLNKPEDSEEAIKMLGLLSGNQHEVITGVSISSPIQQVNFSESTSVQFKDLSSDEINYYVRTYQPFDKAGAYGIQEWIGMIGITGMKGSFYNVMGLPIDRVYQSLLEFSI